MLDNASFLLARAVHVTAGAVWAGAAVLIAVYILPAARATGPAGSAVLRELTAVRRLPEVLLALAGVTILSGLYLFGVSSGGLQRPWLHAGAGLGYTLGGLTAVVAFAIGLGVNIPTARKIGRLASQLQTSGAPPTQAQADMQRRLVSRLVWGTRVVAALVAIATALMAIGHYV